MTSARHLASRLAELLRREQAAMADFLVALADFDRRKVWRDLGFASLFDFLHRELGLSAGAAHYRKTAALLVQRFPEVEAALRDGRLCITSIVELAKVMTPDNRGEVLPRFFHRSKQEAKAVAAELRPALGAPHRDVVTAVREERPAAGAPGRSERAVLPDARGPGETVESVVLAPAEENPGRRFVAAIQPVETNETESPSSPVVAARPQRDAVEPLTADLRRLHVTVSRRFLEKLGSARAALSHARPGASTEEILEAALDALLAKEAKKKGMVERPRPVPSPAKPGHVPAHVKRAVWARDGGRCQWPLASGGICGSTLRVELDHADPRARGGPSTIENLRVLCRFHNDLAARQAFGDEWMDRCSAHAQRRGDRRADGGTDAGQGSVAS